MEYEIEIFVDADIHRLEKKAKEHGRRGYKPSGPITLSNDINPCYVLTMVRET